MPHVIPGVLTQCLTQKLLCQRKSRQKFVDGQRNSVPQKVFAEKILHRSQGSFSDYMSKAPSTMPKTHGRAVWQELNDFLQSEEKQEELLQQLREGKLNNPVTVHIFLNMLKELKVKKK